MPNMCQAPRYFCVVGATAPHSWLPLTVKGVGHTAPLLSGAIPVLPQDARQRHGAAANPHDWVQKPPIQVSETGVLLRSELTPWSLPCYSLYQEHSPVHQPLAPEADPSQICMFPALKIQLGLAASSGSEFSMLDVKSVKFLSTCVFTNKIKFTFGCRGMCS